MYFVEHSFHLIKEQNLTINSQEFRFQEKSSLVVTMLSEIIGPHSSSLDTGSRGVQFELDNKESLTSLMAVIC